MENIEIGDLVCLKSSENYPMTVVALIDYDTENKKAILCKWLSKDGMLQDGEFPKEALKSFSDE